MKEKEQDDSGGPLGYVKMVTPVHRRKQDGVGEEKEWRERGG